MGAIGRMRGLSLSYCTFAQKLARFGGAFGAGLVRSTDGFHPRVTRSVPNMTRCGGPRSYDPFPWARITSKAFDPCSLFPFSGMRTGFALPFADAVSRCGIVFPRPAFFGKVEMSATQQRADKTCANHFLQSPFFPSQPSLAVWTMMQNVPSLVASRVRLLRTPQVAMPQPVLLRGPQLARFAMTRAFAAKAPATAKRATELLALGMRLRVFKLHEKQGFRAGPLGSLFSCA